MVGRQGLPIPEAACLWLGFDDAGMTEGRDRAMREIMRTNDAVLLSAVGALLDAAAIPHLLFDGNMSVLEGSIGILARRVLVPDERVSQARRLIEDAGLGHELRADDDR
jgi:hypothetical protein